MTLQKQQRQEKIENSVKDDVQDARKAGNENVRCSERIIELLRREDGKIAKTGSLQ